MPFLKKHEFRAGFVPEPVLQQKQTQLLHPGYFSSYYDSVFARLLYWGDSFSAVDKPAVIRMALRQERERDALVMRGNDGVTH